MFKVNDRVVYGLTGVCQITDIAKEKYLDQETEYYVLRPLFDKRTIIKTPVQNMKVAMRKIISKEDVLSLIATMPDKEMSWISDNNLRTEQFKAALKTGKTEEWIKLIRTLYLKKQERVGMGKKLTKVDENIMKTAEKQLHEEFAVVLNISPEEVDRYISEHLPYNKKAIS